METTTITGIEDINVTLFMNTSAGLSAIHFETNNGIFTIDDTPHIKEGMTKAQAVRKCTESIEAYLKKGYSFKESEEDIVHIPKEIKDFDYISKKNDVYLQPEITGIRAVAIVRNGYVIIRDEKGNNYTISGILRNSLSNLGNEVLEIMITHPDQTKKEIKNNLKKGLFKDFRCFVYDSKSKEEFTTRFDKICDKFENNSFDFIIPVKTAIWDRKTDLKEIHKSFVHLPENNGMFITMMDDKETKFTKIR